MRLSSFLSGAIIGALIGGVTTLLTTPASGENLRSQAKDYVQGLRDEMQNAAHSKRLELEAELDHLRTPQPKTPEDQVA